MEEGESILYGVQHIKHNLTKPSFQLWINRRVNWLFNLHMATNLGEGKLLIQTCGTLLKLTLYCILTMVEALGKIEDAYSVMVIVAINMAT